MRNATAVPPAYLDRYFASQMKRLSTKEEELAARAQAPLTAPPPPSPLTPVAQTFVCLTWCLGVLVRACVRV